MLKLLLAGYPDSWLAFQLEFPPLSVFQGNRRALDCSQWGGDGQSGDNHCCFVLSGEEPQ
jgi:hypothetical protein